jgi:hypothetical protein
MIHLSVELSGIDVCWQTFACVVSLLMKNLERAGICDSCSNEGGFQWHLIALLF